MENGLKSAAKMCIRDRQNGAWTPWVRNDEGTAGQEGSGLKITGIRMTIVTKGAADVYKRQEKGNLFLL